jgi:uncharacterized protein YbjQ (UPF0145 family)
MKEWNTEVKICTTPNIAGSEIVESLGLVRGATVRSKHIGTDIIASIQNIFGGEQHGYSSLLAAAREQALDRMIADARMKGAHAIVGFRMETSTIMAGSSEIVAYGTAVKIEK